MRNHTISSAIIGGLVDIQDVVINTSLPVAEKKASYIRQIVNPDCFRYDDIAVHVSYSGKGISFEDRIKQLLLSGQGMDLAAY
jgi:hypothetical protein